MSVAEGKARQAAAMNLHAAKCEREERQYILAELKRLALERALANPKGRFSFDDIRDELAAPLPAGFPPRALGSVFSWLSQAGAIKRVGFHVSRVTRNNGHAVGLWQLRSRVAAQKILAEL